MLVHNPLHIGTRQPCPHHLAELVVRHVEENLPALVGREGVRICGKQWPGALRACVDRREDAPHLARRRLQIRVGVRLPLGLRIAGGGNLRQLGLDVIARLHIGGSEAQAAHELGKGARACIDVAIAQKGEQLVGGKVVALAQCVIEQEPDLLAVGIVGGHTIGELAHDSGGNADLERGHARKGDI